MSSLTLNRDGSLNMVLSNQVELTEVELQELGEIERKVSMAHNSESVLKRELALTELALMNNELYIKAIKLRDKIKITKAMQKQAQAILDDKYDNVFKARGMRAADIYMSALPELPAKTGKRGRPRRELMA